MENQEQNQEPQLTPEQATQIELIFNEFEKHFLTIVKIDELKENSILLFRVDPTNVQFIMALPYIARKYEEQFKAKNVSIVITGENDKVEELSEEKMNQLGWQRKGLIITR